MGAVTPRPYQIEAVSKSRKALRKHGRALVVLATALGKTLTSAWTWKGFAKGRGLFLVHSIGILYDAIKDYRKVFGEQAKFALFRGKSKNVEGADIVFATFQAMRGNLKRFPPNAFAWMTIDETHHSQAKSYRPVIEHFTCPRLGITATPDRMDLLDIRELFGKEVIDVPLEEAIARGWLPRIEYHLVTDPGFDDEALARISREVLQEGRRLSVKELNHRIFIKARDEKVAEIIKKQSEKTVIFCRNIAHAEHFKKFLKDAEVYHSGQSEEKNRLVIENLRVGITQRVLAVNAFNEGIDVPDIGLVVFYRTTESETIFRQQLGRGLRPTKKKLVVLDFVGNVARIERLKQLTENIARYHEQYTTRKQRESEGYSHSRLHLSGKGFDFTFTDAMVDIMKIMEKVQTDLYPTWQEASRASKTLGITTRPEYLKRYWEDFRLPSNPDKLYKNFPGCRIFFGKKPLYPTWQQAARAVKRLHIQSTQAYRERHHEDSRLPSTPGVIYSDDWPGYPIFFGKRSGKIYATWQEAGRAAGRLGIKNSDGYKRRHHEDSRLPGWPYSVYKDFPGFRVFLGKEDLYATWQETAKAARKLCIKNWENYRRRCKEDPKLPKGLHRKYKDFPGSKKFFTS